MGLQRKIERRRFIQIVACSAATMLGPGHTFARPRAAWHSWSGEAMGAVAGIDLLMDTGVSPERLIQQCIQELDRVEAMFSLHHSHSAISTLNRNGRVQSPSPDFVRLVHFCKTVHELTAGAFDITVQPLWELFASHFSHKPRPSEGPGRDKIEAARTLVGMSEMHIGGDQIGFAKQGMKITLNGVAQGFATDSVERILRNAGLKHVLVDIGEISARGKGRNGKHWHVGLLNPSLPYEIEGHVALTDRAISTSGGYGLPFDENGKHHHLFDPATGTSARHNLSVSVVAPDALTADALSTALSILPESSIAKIVRRFPSTGAYVTRNDGTKFTIGAFPELLFANP